MVMLDPMTALAMLDAVPPTGRFIEIAACGEIFVGVCYAEWFVANSRRLSDDDYFDDGS